MTSNFKEIPKTQWPEKLHDSSRTNVWINPHFLVQEFQEKGGVIRLTVNITGMGMNGRWKDGISWDALQEIKNAVGYADRDAVEIYPPSETWSTWRICATCGFYLNRCHSHGAVTADNELSTAPAGATGEKYADNS